MAAGKESYQRSWGMGAQNLTGRRPSEQWHLSTIWCVTKKKARPTEGVGIGAPNAKLDCVVRLISKVIWCAMPVVVVCPLRVGSRRGGDPRRASDTEAGL